MKNVKNLLLTALSTLTVLGGLMSCNGKTEMTLQAQTQGGWSKDMKMQD